MQRTIDAGSFYITMQLGAWVTTPELPDSRVPDTMPEDAAAGNLVLITHGTD